MAALTRDQVERAKLLYRTMPGAEPPPIVDGEPMWGDIDGTDEWTFCESIVRSIDEAIGKAVNRFASEHNLI